jgi:hypothetical protein
MLLAYVPATEASFKNNNCHHNKWSGVTLGNDNLVEISYGVDRHCLYRVFQKFCYLLEMQYLYIGPNSTEKVR